MLLNGHLRIKILKLKSMLPAPTRKISLLALLLTWKVVSTRLLKPLSQDWTAKTNSGSVTTQTTKSKLAARPTTTNTTSTTSTNSATTPTKTPKTTRNSSICHVSSPSVASTSSTQNPHSPTLLNGARTCTPS